MLPPACRAFGARPSGSLSPCPCPCLFAAALTTLSASPPGGCSVASDPKRRRRASGGPSTVYNARSCTTSVKVAAGPGPGAVAAAASTTSAAASPGATTASATVCTPAPASFRCCGRCCCLGRLPCLPRAGGGATHLHRHDKRSGLSAGVYIPLLRSGCYSKNAAGRGQCQDNSRWVPAGHLGPRLGPQQAQCEPRQLHWCASQKPARMRVQMAAPRLPKAPVVA